jgi:hypothetical protein
MKEETSFAIEVPLFLVLSLSWDIIYLPTIPDIPVHVTVGFSNL